MSKYVRPLGKWTVLASQYFREQADQGFWRFVGSKSPAFPYSHRYRPICVSSGLADGDAKAMSTCRRAICTSFIERNESFAVSTLTRAAFPQSNSFDTQAISSTRNHTNSGIRRWIEPNTAMWSGFQPSFDTCLSVLVESSVAMWERTQVRNSSVHG